jgi:hypothetical protein
MDGLILKVNIRASEFISTSTNTLAPVVMGAVDPLHIRVQIDESDVWRFNDSAKAVAFLRNKKDLAFPLSFVRAEPYVRPKRNLSGDSTELVDTRIIEVIYRIETKNHPLFVGQQMDVFIEASQ